jgi:hypothetical protein
MSMRQFLSARDLADGTGRSAATMADVLRRAFKRTKRDTIATSLALSSADVSTDRFRISISSSARHSSLSGAGRSRLARGRNPVPPRRAWSSAMWLPSSRRWTVRRRLVGHNHDANAKLADAFTTTSATLDRQLHPRVPTCRRSRPWSR